MTVSMDMLLQDIPENPFLLTEDDPVGRFDQNTCDTLTRVRTVLNQLSYKKGYRFDAILNPNATGLKYDYGSIIVRSTIDYGSIIVRLIATFPDARGDRPSVEIGRSTLLPEIFFEDRTVAQLCKWIFDAVVMPLERHEAQEWFKFDGSLFDDPHKVR